MLHYYIYYRITREAHDEFRKRVTAMQARLVSQAGVAGKLLVRCDDPQTWMEIYENVADKARFEAALDAAVQHYELGTFLAAGEARHMECFVSA